MCSVTGPAAEVDSASPRTSRTDAADAAERKTSLLLLLALLSSCVADLPGTDVTDSPTSVSSPAVIHRGEYV
jgi:hypothetical protein